MPKTSITCSIPMPRQASLLMELMPYAPAVSGQDSARRAPVPIQLSECYMSVSANA